MLLILFYMFQIHTGELNGTGEENPQASTSFNDNNLVNSNKVYFQNIEKYKNHLQAKLKQAEQAYVDLIKNKTDNCKYLKILLHKEFYYHTGNILEIFNFLLEGDNEYLISQDNIASLIKNSVNYEFENFIVTHLKDIESKNLKFIAEHKKIRTNMEYIEGCRIFIEETQKQCPDLSDSYQKTNKAVVNLLKEGFILLMAINWEIAEIEKKVFINTRKLYWISSALFCFKSTNNLMGVRCIKDSQIYLIIISNIIKGQNEIEEKQKFMTEILKNYVYVTEFFSNSHRAIYENPANKEKFQLHFAKLRDVVDNCTLNEIFCNRIANKEKEMVDFLFSAFVDFFYIDAPNRFNLITFIHHLNERLKHMNLSEQKSFINIFHRTKQNFLCFGKHLLRLETQCLQEQQTQCNELVLISMQTLQKRIIDYVDQIKIKAIVCQDIVSRFSFYCVQEQFAVVIDRSCGCYLITTWYGYNEFEIRTASDLAGLNFITWIKKHYLSQNNNNLSCNYLETISYLAFIFNCDAINDLAEEYRALARNPNVLEDFISVFQQNQ